MRDPIEAFFRRLREEDARVPRFVPIPKQEEKKSIVKYTHYYSSLGFEYIQATWKNWTIYVASYAQLTQARAKEGEIFLPIPFESVLWSPATILTHNLHVYKSEYYTYNKHLPKELHFKVLFAYEDLYNNFKKKYNEK